MSTLLDGRWVEMVPDAALKGTLLLAMALAATALMRRAPASQRHLVVLAALAGVLLLPVAAAVVPAWRVLPADASPAAVFRPPAEVPAAPPAAAGIVPTRRRVEPAGSVIRSGGVLAAPAEASAVPPAAPVAMDAPAARLRPRDVALLAWLGGVLVLGLRLLMGVAAVWRMERRCVELTDERWTGLTDRLSRRIGLGRIVRLLRADRSTVPMTWGAFRPVILLPPEADGWDEGRRAAVLAHELAHVRRWDALTQWIAHLAVTIFWFNPLVWMAAHRLRQEREHACDDAVLAVGTRATEYADHLLTIVRSLGSAPGPAAALAMARPSQFEGRLRAILDGATPRRPVSRALTSATAVLALTCVLPLAALRAAEPARGGRGMPIEERARTFGSAGEAAAFLLRLVRDPATPPMAMEEVARASRRITSDAERARVLNAVIDRDDVEATALSLTLASAGEMRSQPLLTAFLRRVARERPVADGAVCDAFFAAVERLRAPGDVRAVLQGVLQQPELDVAVMEKVIRYAGRLEAEALRTVLATAAARQQVRGQALDAYTQAAARLRDPAARREAMDAARLAGAASADTARCRVGCDPRWGAQMRAGELKLEYHEDEPDSTYVRIDARNALLSWREDASEVDLRPAGVVTLRERTAAGVEAVVELREDGDGGVIRSYRVGGVARPWDAEAQRWYEAANRHLYRHIMQ